MIIVIGKKDFVKNAKKLVEKKEYLICDGTGEEDDTFVKYARVVTMEGFNPPSKVIKGKLNTKDLDDVGISEDKLKKLEKKFYKGKEFRTVVMACIKDIVNSSDLHNIYVVLTNKAYKACGKKIVKMIHKNADVDFDFAFTYDDVSGDKSILKKSLKDSKIKTLGKVINKFEKN